MKVIHVNVDGTDKVITQDDLRRLKALSRRHKSRVVIVCSTCNQPLEQLARLAPRPSRPEPLTIIEQPR